MRRVLVLGAGLFLLCGVARAESATAHGNGGLAASASIDFKIVIPPVLALRVGGAATPARVSLDPAAPLLRGARAGLTLDVPAAGTTQGVMLHSNLRQITVVQDGGAHTTVTVVAP